MSGISRKHPVRGSGAARAVVAIGLLWSTFGAPASAQDLVHRFIDPSFGGNPFYSDHLLATAAINRPTAPTTPTPTQSQEDLIAEQLRARFLSTLSGNIIDTITNAKAGDSGTFNFGNQTVTYTKTGTETRITFTNTSTGETNTVVIPAASDGSSTTGGSSTTAAAARAAAAASSSNIAVTGSLTGIQTKGVTDAAALGSASSATPSAEQVLSASLGSSGSTGSVLPPF